jgi:hypothetical protein
VTVSFLGVLWTCFFFSAIAWKSKEAFILCLFSAYAAHQVFKFVAGIEVTRQLCEARRNGSLELLLVTPLEEQKIIEGQEQALKMQFTGVQRLLLVINLCFCAGVLLVPERLYIASREQGIFLELFLGGILMLLLDFKALSTVGMLMALRYQRHNRAALVTLGRIMGIPWAAIFLIVFLGAGGALNGTEPGAVFAIWFAVGIATDLFIGTAARSMLSRGVRECLQMKSSNLSERLKVEPPLRYDYQKCSTAESSV